MQTRPEFLNAAFAMTLSGALSPLAAGAAGGATASISISRSRLGNRLDAAFSGLSYRKTYVSAPLFRLDNAPMVKLFRLLGPSVLRVGGTAVDHSFWMSHGRGGTENQIAAADVDSFAAFLSATGWKALYGINIARNTAGNAADEAGYVARKLGDSLFGFEIGNEPDQYHKQHSPSVGTYDAFKSVWESYASAITAAAPGTLLTGPATSHNTEEYTLPFARDEAGRIGLLTQHYYRASGKSADSTMPLLLAPDARLSKMLRSGCDAARQNGIRGGFRLTECGSFAGGGRDGVSNAYGSALWAIEYLFTLARGGATGANFHCFGSGRAYDPIADDGSTVTQARPGYYGMLLFAQAATGRIADATIISGPPGLSAYAVARDDGADSLVVINPGETSVTAQVALDRRASGFSTLLLTGPSLMATDGMTLGGAAIASDGTWRGAPSALKPISGSAFSTTLPSASAVLIEIH